MQVADELAAQVAGVGALVDPARRALYLHVATATEPVSREEAAVAVGLPLHSAKFHLDRLVAEGLLSVEFRRLSGRTGPGAGRPAKLYRRSRREVSVSLPERRYDVAGEVLAGAIERSAREGTPIADAVDAEARSHGARLATPAPDDDEAGAGENPVTGELARAAALLARLGYEPRVSESQVCLGNCPFHQLAANHTALVCRMNLQLVSGALDALEAGSVTPRLDPEPGMCCVKVSASP